MHRGTILLPLVLTAMIVASSGCISDPTAFARAIPMVNDFLEEHPNAELSIVHYSTSEAEGILDQVKEDCGKLSVEAKEYYFVNLTDPSTGLVVRAWIDWEGKIVECVFKEGIIVDPENCTSLHRSACFGDHVYWYDSCGNREDKKEYCPLGCSNGECVSGRVCETDTSYREKPNCSCPDGYEMVVLYLRCADSITGAITGMPFAVTDATAAKAVQTESGSVEISPEFTTDFELRCPGESPVYRCVKRERCRSHAQSACYRGHVFWFDSCGQVQEKKEYCEEGCEQGFCKGRRTCEEMGGYCIYPTVTSNSGGGGSTSTAASATGSITGNVQAETVSNTESGEKYPACREGYGRASYHCPDNGVCCAPENEKCAGEGEYTTGAVAPEYYYGCCEGLEGFYPWPEGWVGGGSLCYDPAKGTPECMYAGTGDEGWYYPTGELLISADCEHEFCGESTYHECESDEDCAVGGCSGQVCEGVGEGTITVCDMRGCYNAAQYGLDCGCYEGKCQWYEIITECMDSDGGKDYYVKGTTSGRKWVDDDELTERTDYCVTLTGSAAELSQCEGDNCGVYEFECTAMNWAPDKPFVNGNIEPCPYGCENGACLEPECRDEDYSCYIGDISCCAGLVEVPVAEMVNGTCIAANCGSVCRPCGNGVCEDNENYCTCPEDCA